MTTAADVARGVSRLLIQEGFSPILEFSLANGRRLDVAALGADGTVAGVEIKVAVADLKCDGKWPDYLEFCELFYFAIPPDFPDELVPREHGTDRGRSLWRRHRAARAAVGPAREPAKAVTFRFANVAAERLALCSTAPTEPRRARGPYRRMTNREQANARRDDSAAARDRAFVSGDKRRHVLRQAVVSRRRKVFHATARRKTIQWC